MFIQLSHPKLVRNIFDSCGCPCELAVCEFVGVKRWVGVDMSVQGQYHSRGGKERRHEGEGTGLGTENSLLGRNCNEAPTNHKTLLSSLAPCSLTHQTIYIFDLQPRHLQPTELCAVKASKHTFNLSD